MLIRKLRKHIQALFLICICACGLASCVNPKQTLTDEYLIFNDLDMPVTMQFSEPIAWDTCPAGTFIRVMYDNAAELPAHKQIRLHPIVREYEDPAMHRVEAGYLLGEVTKLIVGTDTIVWESKYKRMFSSDSIWSIYNSDNWDIVKDPELPYTYYQTFRITQDQLERSLYENKN